MRKMICLTMGGLFLLTIAIGIAESYIHPGRAGHHVVVAIVFIAATFAHIVFNRRSLVRYLGGKQSKKPE
jgi:hypothetical protein